MGQASSLANLMRRLLLATSLLCLCSGCLSPVATTTTPAPTSAEEPPQKAKRPDPNAVLPITYEDLDIPLKPDSVFKDWMLTQRIRDLHGKRVRITGFICAGSAYDTQRMKQFMMLREQECPYGPGGQAHHAIAVELREPAKFTVGPLTVEGVLSVKPFTGWNGNTWSLYALSDASIR